MVGGDEPADDADALLDEIDRRAMELEPVISALIALEDETTVFAQQQAGFIDGCRAQSVASIARAAVSGSSASVIGRPITNMEAP